MGDHPVECGDVLDPAIFQPVDQSIEPLACKDRNSILPGGPATEHTRKGRASFGGQLQSFPKDFVADAGAQIEERFWAALAVS